MKHTNNDPDRIPGWMWALICVILGIAVLIGIVAFVLKMGYFEEGFDLNAIPTNIEQTEEIEGPEQETEEEEVAEPESKACTALAISQEEVTLHEVGDRAFLTAVASPADCEDEIIYTSADEEIASVSASGMITAVAPGVVEVSVSCGEIIKVCIVTCDFELPEEETTEETTEEEETQEPEEETQEESAEPAPAPEVTPSDFTLFYPGEEAYLVVKNVPEGAAVSYVSSNASVVTVTEGGKVTAIGNGQATITVTVGDVKLTSIARCNLESTTEGGSGASNTQTSYTGPFTLNYSDVTFQFSGEKLTLTLTDSTGATVTGLSWSSGNSAVCTVSGSTVTAVGRGETTVSTTYNGTTYSCIIRTGF